MSTRTLSDLRYCKETGLFSRSHGMSKVGCLSKNGYITIGIAGKRYQAHRLAWFLSFGVFPNQSIDHINGIKTDNRLINLRSVTAKENAQNRRFPAKRNKSGVLGVSFEKNRGKYRADIFVDGKCKFLGRFATLDLAQEAYVFAKRQFHDGCTI